MIADTTGKSSCAQHVTLKFAYGDEERNRWAGKTEAT